MIAIHFSPQQVRAFVEHDEVPDEVRCPISCELMQHPVRVAQNHKSVYSRDSLANALAHRPQDPKTRAPLTHAGVEAAPQERQAVHTLLLQAASYAEARAGLPGAPRLQAAYCPEAGGGVPDARRLQAADNSEASAGLQSAPRLQATNRTEASAGAPGADHDSAAFYQACARRFRLRQAFQAWREERLPPLPPAAPLADLPAVGGAPRQGVPMRPWVSAHGMVAAHAPGPEPTTLLDRLWQPISNFLARVLVERAVRAYFRLS